MGADISLRNDNISACMKKIAEYAPQVVVEYRQKLRDRIKEALDEIAIDEARLANEVAFFTDKADISEELARMQSHQQQLREVLSSAGPIGRKLEFILQEMNREINTIGSKANDLELSKLVIEVKSELEKMREQVQNIE